MLFHIVLNARVDGSHEIAAVLAGAVFLVAFEQHLPAVGVGGPETPARRAGKGFVISRLDPLEAVIVGADKAQQMAGKPAVRVITLAVGLEADAAELVLGLEAADLSRRVRFDLAGDSDVPAAAAPGFFVDLVIVEAKDFRQSPCDERAVLAVRFDLGGTEIDVIHRGAYRQDVAVAVVDNAALRRARYGPQLLGDGQFLVEAVFRDLQMIKSCKQNGKSAHAEYRREHRAPSEHLPSGTRRGLGFICHVFRLRCNSPCTAYSAADIIIPDLCFILRAKETENPLLVYRTEKILRCAQDDILLLLMAIFFIRCNLLSRSAPARGAACRAPVRRGVPALQGAWLRSV